MPPPSDLRLALMSFPQRWDGATLSLNLLHIPSVDPLAANYEATLQGSLDSEAAAGRSFTYDVPGVGQGKITLGHSFATSYSRVCRDFSREEVRGTSRSGGDGLACRGPDGGWSIMFFHRAS